jgi:hypothetical protein
MTWQEVRRLWSKGLSGYWSLAVFLVIGHAACHLTGPSVILSVILAAITSALSGEQMLRSCIKGDKEPILRILNYKYLQRQRCGCSVFSFLENIFVFKTR